MTAAAVNGNENERLSSLLSGEFFYDLAYHPYRQAIIGIKVLLHSFRSISIHLHVSCKKKQHSHDRVRGRRTDRFYGGNHQGCVFFVWDGRASIFVDRT